MGNSVLFEPVELLGALHDTPNLHRTVKAAIRRHSRPSTIERVQISSLPLLYLLGHGNDPFLERWKTILESALIKGWKGSEMLQTDQQNFYSLLAELYVAQEFESVGLKVQRAKQGDVLVQLNEASAEIEVYAPVQMLTLHSFIHGIGPMIEAIDIPSDFFYVLNVQNMEWWDEELCGYVQLSEELQTQRLEKGNQAKTLREKITNEVKESLSSATTPIVAIEDEDVGLKIGIEFYEVKQRNVGKPIRGGSTHTGRSLPAGLVFARISNLIETKIREKLAKKQSEAGLVIYVGEMMDRHSFETPFGAGKVETFLRSEFSRHPLTCNFVAFLAPDNSQRSGFRFTHVAYNKLPPPITLDCFGVGATCISINSLSK